MKDAERLLRGITSATVHAEAGLMGWMTLNSGLFKGAGDKVHKQSESENDYALSAGPSVNF